MYKENKDNKYKEKYKLGETKKQINDDACSIYQDI